MSSLIPFSCKIQILRVRVKVSYFYKTLKIFDDFSRENHGHGGHEHGVRRGFSGESFHLRRCPQGGRLCSLQENPHFWVPTIKVRPPDGTFLGLLLSLLRHPGKGQAVRGLDKKYFTRSISLSLSTMVSVHSS